MAHKGGKEREGTVRKKATRTIGIASKLYSERRNTSFQIGKNDDNDEDDVDDGDNDDGANTFDSKIKRTAVH